MKIKRLLSLAGIICIATIALSAIIAGTMDKTDIIAITSFTALAILAAQAAIVIGGHCAVRISGRILRTVPKKISAAILASGSVVTIAVLILSAIL